MPKTSDLTQFLNENQPEEDTEMTSLVDLLSVVLSGGPSASAMLNRTQGGERERDSEDRYNDSVKVKRLKDQGFLTKSGALNQEKFTQLAQGMSFLDLVGPLVGVVKKKLAKTRRVSEELLRSEGYDIEYPMGPEDLLSQNYDELESSGVRQSLTGE